MDNEAIDTHGYSFFDLIIIHMYAWVVELRVTKVKAAINLDWQSHFILKLGTNEKALCYQQVETVMELYQLF